MKPKIKSKLLYIALIYVSCMDLYGRKSLFRYSKSLDSRAPFWAWINRDPVCRRILFLIQKQNQSLQCFVIFAALFMSLGRFCLDTKSQRYISEIHLRCQNHTPFWGLPPTNVYMKTIYLLDSLNFPQIVFTFFICKYIFLLSTYTCRLFIPSLFIFCSWCYLS